MPLQGELARRLKEHVSDRPPTEPAFSMPDRTRTADFVRMDLAAARARWLEESSSPEERRCREQASFLKDVDEHGRRVDFHALRTTTASMLAEFAVPQAIAQRIMGHASYATTAKHYVRVQDAAVADRVKKLPELWSVANNKGGGDRERIA